MAPEQMAAARETASAQRAASTDSAMELQVRLAVPAVPAARAAEPRAEPLDWAYPFPEEQPEADWDWVLEPLQSRPNSRLPSQKLQASLIRYIYDETSDRKLLNVYP
jgi:hypothetical protein